LSYSRNDRAGVGPARRKAAGFAACEDGSAIVEFAIILPVLVVLAAGCFEFGRALFIRAAMENAVRGGARLLAQVSDPTCSPVCSRPAAAALAMTRRDIAANTGLAEVAVLVSAIPDPVPGTIVLKAEARVGFSLLPLLGLDSVLTLTAAHRERTVEG